jgi:hypothetical protein
MIPDGKVGDVQFNKMVSVAMNSIEIPDPQ